MLWFFETSAADPRRKGNTDMDAERVPKPARPRLNPYTKALSQERIFSRLRMGGPPATRAAAAPTRHPGRTPEFPIFRFCNRGRFSGRLVSLGRG